MARTVKPLVSPSLIAWVFSLPTSYRAELPRDVVRDFILHGRSR